MKNIAALIWLSAVALNLGAQQPAAPIYVNRSALGANDGSSWADAFVKLQDALEAAEAGGEIWVAQGLYTPADSAGPREAAFVLDKNLRLFGGFAGNEASLAERGDPAARPTILSGDLNGDDLPDNLAANRGDNAYTVIHLLANITNETLIDGFTIRGGHADGVGANTPQQRGGGVYALGAPIIRRCTFELNLAQNLGGGLFLAASSAGFRLESCRFVHNQGSSGGGAYSEARPFRIEGCSFENNRAAGGGTNGGGGLRLVNPSGALRYTDFQNNTAAQNGAGLYATGNVAGLSLEVRFCVFRMNEANRGGGINISQGGSSFGYALSDCEFTGNSATLNGGGLHLVNPNTLIARCAFSYNTAEQDGGGFFVESGGGTSLSALALQSCQFTGNRATLNGGGLYANLASAAVPSALGLEACSFADNSSSQHGGGLYASLSSGAAGVSGLDLEACAFVGNSAAKNGGGLYAEAATAAARWDVGLRGSIFEGNRASSGGGIGLAPAGAVVRCQLSACHFDRNLASFDGAGFFWLDAQGALLDCTFRDNDAGRFGGGIHARGSEEAAGGDPLALRSCAFNGNRAREGGGLSWSAPASHGSLAIADCRFEENEATDGGGLHWSIAALADSVRITLERCDLQRNMTIGNGSGLQAVMRGQAVAVDVRQCRFEGNTAIQASAAADFWGTGGATGKVWVDSCAFEGNTARFSGALEMGNGYGGGATVDFTVSNTLFRTNQAEEGGALTLWSDGLSGASHVVGHCRFEDNVASRSGGGMMLWAQNPGFRASIQRCRFFDNASPAGAAIAADLFLEVPVPQEASLLLDNSLFAGNASEQAVVSIASGLGLALRNCTLADNWGNGLLLSGGGRLRLLNTILYNPGYQELIAQTAGLAIQSQGGNLIGDGSLNAWLNAADQAATNPLLETGYQLSAASPAIDAGMAYDEMPALDLAGNPRLQGSCIDIGAFESPYDAGTDCLVVRTSELIPTAMRLSLHPNPTSSFLYIRLPDDSFDGFDVQLLDAQGRILGQHRLHKGAPLNVEPLPPGLYWLRAAVAGKLYLERFVKW